MRHHLLLYLLLVPLGVSAQLTFEVRPGERLLDWCGRLESRGLLTCDNVLAVATSDPLDAFAAVPPPTPAGSQRRLEGLFLPGAYTLPAQALPIAASAMDTTRLIITHLLRHSTAAFDTLSRVHGLSPHQQRILASLVQKEAVAGRDQRRVAAVFLNRLQRGDPLGSCPAVEYALGYHRPFLLYADLDRVADSPYNLYKKLGLPPSPICFFEPRALAAVRASILDPELYFFVCDWTVPRLHFARINQYEQHQKNARQAKENYRRRHGDIRRKMPDKFYSE